MEPEGQPLAQVPEAPVVGWIHTSLEHWFVNVILRAVWADARVERKTKETSVVDNIV